MVTNLSMPDFFIVGAPKCGTTAMVEYLSANPTIFIPRIKEPHYFCTDFEKFRRVRTSEAYANLYAAARPGQLRGDASVWYLYSRTAATEIAAAIPDARIVVMTRDPVRMLPSLHNQLVFSGREEVPSFAEAWAKCDRRRKGLDVPTGAVEPSHLLYDEVADYEIQIARYREAFGSERVLVLPFEAFVEGPAEAVCRVTRFIGAPVPERIETPVVNAARRHRFPRLAASLRNPPWPLSRAKAALKSIPWVRRNAPLRPLYNVMSARQSIPPPSDDLAAAIRAHYGRRGSDASL